MDSYTTTLLVIFLVNAIAVNGDNDTAVPRALLDHFGWKNIPKNACGTTRSPSRIVGGNEAFLGQFPWALRLGYKNSLEYKFTCGAALISDQFAITAAHCVEMSNDYILRVGENNIESAEDCEIDVCAPEVQDIPVAKNIIHPKYEKEKISNDIAVLKLSQKAQFSEFVQPICLPQDQLLNYRSAPEGSAVVAGWGLVSSHHRYESETLQYVSLPLQQLDKCKNLLYGGKENDAQYCAGGTQGKDSCQGDSGGPLMKSFKMHGQSMRRMFLMGITSFGPGTCGSGPAVYTKVSFFMDWILNQVAKN